MSLTATVLASITEQNRITALENCFHSWDGEIDDDVILQGIHDRYIAMGKPLEGIQVRRHSLHKVCVSDTKGRDLLTVLDYPDVQTHSVHALHKDLFHTEELKVLGKYLVDNVHHLN